MKMALSDSLELILDKKRVNLYYDKYKYKTVVHIPLIQYFREIDSYSKYEKRLDEYLTLWDGLGSRGQRAAKSIREIIEVNSANAIAKFAEIVTWRQYFKNIRDFRFTIKYDTIELYTSELDLVNNLLKRLKQFNVDSKVYYAEKITDYDIGKVYHINPKFKTRIYFKLKRLTDEAEEFKQFLKTYEFSLSPSLRNALDKKRRLPAIPAIGLNRPLAVLIQEHFFVDINDDQLITVLALRYPNFIRKICKIEKR